MGYSIDFLEDNEDESKESLIIATLTRLIFSPNRRLFYPKGEVASVIFNGERVEVELARDLFQVREGEWLVGGDRYAIEGDEVLAHCFGVDVVAAFTQTKHTFGVPFVRMESPPKLSMHAVNVLFDRLDTPPVRYLARHLERLESLNNIQELKLRQTLVLSSDPHNLVYVDLSLFRRLEIRPSVKKRTEKRYAIIEEFLGQGRSSSVSVNKRTLRLRDGEFHETQRKRAVHEMKLSVSQRVTLHELNKHDQLLQRLSFLKAKPTYIIKQASGFPKIVRFEKCMPGESLKVWINAESMNASFERRCQIATAALRALKTQVHDNGVIHCDIKPENVMVKITKQGEVQVNFIDYNLSCLQSDMVNKDYVRGTSFYVPYEVLTTDKNEPDGLESPKRDVYALGVTLGQVFGATLGHLRHIEEVIRCSQDYRFVNLFNGVEGATDEIKSEARALLLRLVACDPSHRPDPEAAAAEFEAILEKCRESTRLSYQV